jgi:hypothetical protein
MLEFADKIIKTYQYGSEPTTRDLRRWELYLDSAIGNPGPCLALSPTSRQSCKYQDSKLSHLQGMHMGDKAPIAWAVTNEDRARWNADTEISTEKI